MSDRSTVYRALGAPGLVFVRPTRAIFMQDELHDAARDTIKAQGLPATTSYVGWHWQQHGFSGKGVLGGFQYVYWGGDAATVRARLDTLGSDGYLVVGGRTPAEPFVIAKEGPVREALAAIDAGERPAPSMWQAVTVLAGYDVVTPSQAETLRAWRESDAVTAAARRAAEKKALDDATPAPLKAIEQIGRRWKDDDLPAHEIDDHADTLRAVLAEPKATEPQLALALELLIATGGLQAADIAALRKGWRKRLLRKPDPYLAARPAVVGFAIGLLIHGDEIESDVVGAVLSDQREWMTSVREVMLGVLAELGAEFAREHLAEEGASTGRGAIAHVRAVCMQKDEEVAVVAGRLWSATPAAPPYLRAHYAAAAVALEPAPRTDWDISTYRFRLDRQRAVAAGLAADARLPDGMRAWLKEHAEP